MSLINFTFLLIGLRLLWSGGIQIFAAHRVSPERKEPLGGLVFADYLRSGIFDIVMSSVEIFGALFGHFELTLPVWVSGIILILFELKSRSVDRLALTMAGVIRENK